MSAPRTLPKRRTKSGWAITSVHWSVVPGYDRVAAGRGMSEAEQRMEFEIDWTATRGKRVYPEASREVHVAKEPIPFDQTLPMHCGFDVPGTPAFVPAQVNAYGQLCLWPSLSPPEEESIGVWEFGDRVANHLLREYAAPIGMGLDDLKLVMIGDPAGRNPVSRTGAKRQETRAAFDILNRGSKMYLGEDDRGETIYEERPGWGWRLIPGAMDNTTRQDAVRARLTKLLPGGLPALIIDPRADVIISGFMGAYRYKEYEDGSFSREPLKDYWSHTMNCVEYLCTRLFASPRQKRDVDEDEPARPPVVSQASNRMWR